MYSLYINVSPPPLVRKRQCPFHAVKLPKNILTATEISNTSKSYVLEESYYEAFIRESMGKDLREEVRFVVVPIRGSQSR